MTLTQDQRYEALAILTNRQFAHAVVYGGLSDQEAAIFNQWVLLRKRGHRAPAENLQDWDGKAS